MTNYVKEIKCLQLLLFYFVRLKNKFLCLTMGLLGQLRILDIEDFPIFLFSKLWSDFSVENQVIQALDP